MNDDSETPHPNGVEKTQDGGADKLLNHADNKWTLRNKLIAITTLISTFGFGLSLTSVLVASKALTTSTETQRQFKAVDLRQYCQKRYDDLAYDTKLRASEPNQAKIYYRRFWDLQFEQYQYCRDGLIEPQIYATWMAARRLEWDSNEPVGGVEYQKGWTDMKDFFLHHDYGGRGDYKEFVDFMDGVFHGTTQTCVKR